MRRIKAKKFLLVAGAFVAIAVGLLWAVVFSFRVANGEYAFTKNFERVAMGFEEAQVVALLGNPAETGKEFRLGQYDGFENAYKRASDSNAKNYWFWFQDLDIVYAVGFNEHGKVVVAEYGGT